jgi:diacylglycerol O-acyltransferase
MRHSRAHGVSLAFYDVLLELQAAPEGRLTMGDLGSRVVLSRSRVSRVVNEMMRAGLASRGERLERLVISVPVSDRTAAAPEPGNYVGVIPVVVPLVPDPFSRLTAVAAMTRALGRRLLVGPRTLSSDRYSACLRRMGVFRWFVDHQRLVNTFVTNMRGPEERVRLVDAYVTSVVPLTGTTGNVTVAFWALSYAGDLTLSVVTDPDQFPDLPVLVSAWEHQLALLGIRSSSSTPMTSLT